MQYARFKISTKPKIGWFLMLKYNLMEICLFSFVGKI